MGFHGRDFRVVVHVVAGLQHGTIVATVHCDAAGACVSRDTHTQTGRIQICMDKSRLLALFTTDK